MTVKFLFILGGVTIDRKQFFIRITSNLFSDRQQYGTLTFDIRKLKLLFKLFYFTI